MDDNDKVFDPTKQKTKKIERHIPTKQLHPEFTFKPGNTPADYAQHIVDNTEPQQGLVKAWSVSTLKAFETCSWKTWLKQVVKMEEEKNEAMQRGTDIHQMCEDYVTGALGDFPDKFKASPKFKKFLPLFEKLREEYANAKVEVEGNWGFNTDWEVVDWMAPDIWARMKLDVFQWHTEEHGTCIDHKTGKKFGNEVAHADAAMIYTVGSFMRYPQLQLLDVDFWYLDQGEHSFPQRYTRAQAMTFLPRITERALKMTTATEKDFVARPSVYNCQWCPFNKEGGCDKRFIG